jgi:hypothetical protein
MNIHRHGEVVLIPCELPVNATLKSKGAKLIVGHSESGHHHALTATKDIEVYEAVPVFDEREVYLAITTPPTLTHMKTGLEVHAPQTIEPGTYKRVIKKAYSYPLKQPRSVID